MWSLQQKKIGKTTKSLENCICRNQEFSQFELSNHFTHFVPRNISNTQREAPNPLFWSQRSSSMLLLYQSYDKHIHKVYMLQLMYGMSACNSSASWMIMRLGDWGHLFLLSLPAFWGERAEHQLGRKWNYLQWDLTSASNRAVVVNFQHFHSNLVFHFHCFTVGEIWRADNGKLLVMLSDIEYVGELVADLDALQEAV